MKEQQPQVKTFPADSVESRQHFKIMELEKQLVQTEACRVQTAEVNKQAREDSIRHYTAKILELQEKIFVLQEALVKANAKLLRLYDI